ncbi:MAG: type I 3-dehydroquinate dehydratase [Acidobacteriota bacterium]|nr:type I 3-dehydroquinate dehydratase [Acidobacteriota bacterium]
MQLVVTIHEPTQDAAIGAIRSLHDDHDMVEVRLDAFGGRDVEPFRGVTPKPMIFTNRGGEPVESDFGLIDVEYGRKVKYPDRTVLSFHDFEGMPGIDKILGAMTALSCAHTKLAVTPHTLRENEALLAAIRPGITIIGMGDAGLYSRVLAPFFGSELFFAGSAAPGQIPLDRALAIYGDRKLRKPDKIFAIAGYPARQSLSPTIHNPLFRKAGVAGAYTIASFETFAEIAEAFENLRIAGLSVTAPFKGDALEFAKRIGADVRPNADDAAAVNTLVRTQRGVIADNTDVDGFEILLRGVHARRAAVVGAGATARAAIVALQRSGKDIRVYNRSPKLGAEPIDNLASFRGDLVVDTLPPGVHVPIPAGMAVIAAAYDRGGLQLLQAQAIRQNALFLEAFR